jgi:hypothetical protein
MTSVYGQLACAVALGAAAVVVQRRSPGRRTMLATESGLLVCLGAGWVWVWQREMLTSPSVVAVWLVFTTPGLVAAALVALTTRTPPGAPQAVEAPPA